MGGQRYAPAALSPGKTRYPLYRRLGGPQGRSGQVRKISLPPGFDGHKFFYRNKGLVADCCEYANESLDSIKDGEEHVFGYTARFCFLELVLKLIKYFL